MANHPIEADFSDKHRQKVIIITALVSAIGFIDATALNVALPFIQESLNATATDIHWVLEIYLLFLAALLMAGGALGDTLGRRRPLRWGRLFALTSLGCALSPSAEWLIFFRALQGISAALMIPASLALINAGFASEARGAAIGKWSAIVALAIPIGPLIGGDYAQNLVAALADTGLSSDKQAFLIENRAMIAAIILPSDWPASEQEIL